MYYLLLLFTTCSSKVRYHNIPQLDTKIGYKAANKNDIAMVSDKQYERKDPIDWMFVCKNVRVPMLEIFNEATETHQIIIVCDPKFPHSNVSPACVVMNQQSNTCFSIFGRLILNISLGIYLGGALATGSFFFLIGIISFRLVVKHEP